MISFIVPAHNEAILIGRTLKAIEESARQVGDSHEIIVVDDASNDDTRQVALRHGAQVLSVDFRRIAATRNAGGRASIGEFLFFVDADTVVTAPAVRAALRALRNGAVGGGATVRFDGPVPLYAAVLERIVLPVLLPLLQIVPGCFMFCTRRAYFAAGGFDEELAWSEEVRFARRLQRQGRFVLLRERVFTSGRKLRVHTALSLAGVAARLALRRGSGLDYWYGSRHATEPDLPHGLGGS
jgi:glycosyltransferase involved in cell wall biosynthesis